MFESRKLSICRALNKTCSKLVGKVRPLLRWALERAFSYQKLEWFILPKVVHLHVIRLVLQSP